MSYADTSPIDAILDKPEFTLEDLLDEDHIIQESKGENEKLLAYLTREEVLAKLIQYAFRIFPWRALPSLACSPSYSDTIFLKLMQYIAADTSLPRKTLEPRTK
jgi:hypothetical protein